MDGRTFVVSDIHGCVEELETLLAGLDLGAGDTLACVGDYIDRGPDSRGVIELLRAHAARPDLGTVFLRGNHEDMCLAWLGRGGRYGEVWLHNGGVAALRSWGATGPPWPRGDELAAILGPEHLAFLEGLVSWHEIDEYLLVHAGIRPGVSLAAQDEEDLFWIRGEFIHAAHDLGRTVIFGHTPVRDVLVDLPYKIGIDTGCVYGGALTALELPERVLHQVARGARRVRRHRLAAGKPRRA